MLLGKLSNQAKSLPPPSLPPPPLPPPPSASNLAKALPPLPSNLAKSLPPPPQASNLAKTLQTLLLPTPPLAVMPWRCPCSAFRGAASHFFVATGAFGMGINKLDVRQVVQLGGCKSFTDYVITSFM